jgi:hypothetical protein
MKSKFLIGLIMLVSVSTKAQDSSAIYLPIMLKQKFTAALVPQSYTAADMRLADTLRKAIGTGTKPDSVATVYFKAGTFYKLVENLLQQQVGGYYAFASDFFTSTLAGSGYSGLTEQLNYWALNSPNKAAATWLRTQIAGLLARHEAVLTENLIRGAERAKTAITYN